MSPYDRQTLDAAAGVPEAGTSVDSLIRPCLSKAFPLPEMDRTGDERFHALLDALSQRGRGASPGEAPLQGPA